MTDSVNSNSATFDDDNNELNFSVQQTSDNTHARAHTHTADQVIARAKTVCIVEDVYVQVAFKKILRWKIRIH